MTKANVYHVPAKFLWSSLTLVVACDFGGDRSLGTLESSAGAPPIATVATLPQAGAAGTPIATTALAPPSCDPMARPNDCATGQFCALYATCSLALGANAGYCREQPTECAAPSGFEVVCGCDGQYYESRCLAWRDGVSVAQLSACERVPCLSNLDCERFAESCVDAYGTEITGAGCYDSVCACGGNPSQVIL